MASSLLSITTCCSVLKPNQNTAVQQPDCITTGKDSGQTGDHIKKDAIPALGSYVLDGEPFILHHNTAKKTTKILVPAPLPESFRCEKCLFTCNQVRAIKSHWQKKCLKSSVDISYFCQVCHDEYADLQAANRHHRQDHPSITTDELVSFAGKELQSYSFTQQVIDGVKGTAWINDEVMDFCLLLECMKFLKEFGGTKVFPVSSQFITSLEAFEQGSSFGQNQVRPWITTVQKILFPVNHGKLHWSLLVFNTRDGSVHHFDSLPSDTHETRAQWAAENFSRVLETRFSCNMLKNFSYVSEKCSSQSDSHNCGIHVLMNAVSYVRNGQPGKNADCGMFRADLSNVLHEHFRQSGSNSGNNQHEHSSFISPIAPTCQAEKGLRTKGKRSRQTNAKQDSRHSVRSSTRHSTHSVIASQQIPGRQPQDPNPCTTGSPSLPVQSDNRVDLQSQTPVAGLTSPSSAQSLKVRLQPGDTLPCDLFKGVKPSRIIQRLPKGARESAARALIGVLRRVVQENSDISWQRLFSFPSLCLSRPPKATKCSNLTTYIKGCIETFVKDPALVFSDEMDTDRKGTGNAKRNKDTSTYIRKTVSAKINAGDTKGAIRFLSSQDTLAPYNAETSKALHEKHPPGKDILCDYPQESTEGQDLAFCDREIRKSIVSFPPGSSGGPDGLVPQHLKDLTATVLGTTAETLLDSLASFCTLVSAGKVAPSVVPYFFGARLVALKKKDGGIRPIAVGMTMRRLTAKLANTKIIGKASSGFSPHQVGFGVKNGAEAAIHAVRQYWDDNKGSDKVILKIDFKNAFNKLDRSKILAVIKKDFPEVFPLVLSSYGSETYLQWGKEIIFSSDGVQQGDPMGPFLFCAGIQDIVHSLSSEINLWYLDDGTLAGDPESVHDDFKTVMNLAEKVGLSVNPSKCEIFSLAHDSEVAKRSLDLFRGTAPSIRTLDADHATLLGGAIQDESVTTLLSQKLSEMERMCANLRVVDSHEAVFLLKNCLALPKLTYLLRTTPCFGQPQLFEFDEALRKSLESILNTRLDSVLWDRANMPVSLGGIGLRQPSDFALPAYISSMHASRNLVQKIIPQTYHAAFDRRISGAVESFKSVSMNQVPDAQSLSIQRSWDHILCRQKYDGLLANTKSDVDRASLLAVACPYSGSWLNAIPSSALGLKLSNDQVRVAVALRIGAKVCEEHLCVCGKTADERGHHALSCGRLPGRRVRHSQVNMILHRALNSAQLPSVLEPPGLSRVDGKRPDGKTLVPWENGRSVVWDFTCWDTVAASHLHSSSKKGGKVAEIAEQQKTLKYNNLSDQYIFAPVAIETFGPWGDKAFDFVTKIGKKLSDVSGERRSKEYLFQSISMAVQRGNGISVLATTGVGPVLDLASLN